MKRKSFLQLSVEALVESFVFAELHKYVEFHECHRRAKLPLTLNN